GTVATMPMLLGLLVINRYPFGPFAHLKQVVDELILPMFRGVSVPAFGLISILAGLGEEMLFRGFLQGGLAEVLSDRLGPSAATWCALIAASLVFGLLHPITRLYAVLCFAVGVYLGLLWIMTGNLLAPIVTHALYDFFALVYLTRGGGKSAAGNAADAGGPPATQPSSIDGPADV
ncbi:MAG: CPBP family intramembrane metalloprotease, partial [Planctomycetota bacterium]|nr:CPBP family intramembrane metalloprotease [Planctomycetota bacterium]